MTHLVILTGASRGMGLAMAEQLLEAGTDLLCISRRRNEMLAEQARAADAPLLQWQEDLSRSAEGARRLGRWLERQDGASFSSATLINNAGAIVDVRPVRALDSVAIQQALAVGIEAPMNLTASFLRATQHWVAPRKVLNISSGLARRPMASQSSYCAAKAALDHFTRCLALEENTLSHGARVCALSPGGVDTDMMTQLRDADPAAFPDHSTFVDAKTSGRLMPPAVAARRVLAFLGRPDFGIDPIADLRDFPPGA